MRGKLEASLGHQRSLAYKGKVLLMAPETLVLSDYGTVIGKDNSFCPCEIAKQE